MSSFSRLIQEICERFLLEDPVAVEAGQSIAVDGIPVAFVRPPDATPDQFSIVVDFGKVDEGDAAVLATALRRNFELAGHPVGGFALEPQRGRLVFVRPCVAGQGGPLDVIDALMAVVNEAKAWADQERG